MAIDYEYTDMISPVSTCQILVNDDDINGQITILQDSLYSSVVNIRLAHIDPGEYTLMVHENEVEDNDCESIGDGYLFGQEQYGLNFDFTVGVPSDSKFN